MSEIVIHSENRNPVLPLTISGGALAIMYSLKATSAMASQGNVNADVKTGIEDSIATVKALSPLALACLSVALVPLGAMLTLRFLNMVLSRV